MKLRTIGILALSAAVGGCATTKIMDGVITSWEGAHIDAVIERWGYPSAERIVAGHRLYDWNRQVAYRAPTVATVQADGTSAVAVVSGGASDWSCTRTLEVDDTGIVIGGEWAGNNCPFAEAGPYRDWRR